MRSFEGDDDSVAIQTFVNEHNEKSSEMMGLFEMMEKTRDHDLGLDEAIISKVSFFGNASKDIACAIYNLNKISVCDSNFKAPRDYIVDGENAASRLVDNVFIK